MRIVVVFDNMKYGGIQRVGISHIKLLRELGHRIDAIVLSRETEEIIKELEDSTDNIFFYNFSRFFCPEYFCILAERYTWGKYIYPIVYLLVVLFNQIQKFFISNPNKYDLAIAFSGHFNDLNYVARNFVKAKIKGCWLHGAQYDYYIMSRGFPFLYKKIKNLIVLSNSCDLSCKKIQDLFRLKPIKLYNPIKVAEKTPDKAKIKKLKSDYGDYLLFVGRLANDKDPETIIKALPILKEKYGIIKHLLLVGDGPKKKDLENLVQSLCLEKYVHFEGMRKDVENYYCSAYLFIHSSPLEGLPTTILESMSYSLPVIATDSMPGVREVLGNNGYGLICPVGNSELMAQCVMQLENDPILYKYYQKEGLLRIQDFSPNIIKDQLNQILNTWMNV